MKDPERVLFLNDFGEDVDDPFAVIIGQALARLGQLQLTGVVVGTDPSDYRSQLGRGVLDRIGCRDVPLAAGRGRGDEFWFTRTPWVSQSEFRPAAEFLLDTYRNAEEKSLTFVVMAPMTDLALFLFEHQDLFEQKTKAVQIMGGVAVNEQGLVLNESGHFLPDSAKNCFFNKAAADLVYKFLQTWEIPTTVITRHAAYQAAVAVSDFRRLGETGNEVGSWLASGLAQHFNEFWHNVHLPENHPIRLERQMPARQNRDWFIKVILKGEGADRALADKIDDLVQTVPVYDALSVIAAAPELFERFFEPEIVKVHGACHRIVGLSAEKNGVKDPAFLVAFMLQEALKTLRASAREAKYTRRRLEVSLHPAGAASD